MDNLLNHKMVNIYKFLKNIEEEMNEAAKSLAASLINGNIIGAKLAKERYEKLEKEFTIWMNKTIYAEEHESEI